MPPDIRAVATAVKFTGATGVTIDNPGAQDGDILVFVIASAEASTDVTSYPDASWEGEQRASGGGQSLECAYKLVAASEGATWSFGWSGSHNGIATVVVVDGSTVDNLANGTPSIIQVVDPPFTTQSLTTDVDGCLILSFFSTDAGATNSWTGGGDTEIFDDEEATLFVSLGIYSSIQSTAGAVTKTVTPTGSTPAVFCGILAFSPDAGSTNDVDIAVTGGGTVAMTVDVPIDADIAVSGGGTVSIAVDVPIDGDIAVSGGGTVSMQVDVPITADITLAGEDGTVAIAVDNADENEIAIAVGGGGTVAMVVDVPIDANITVSGGGTVGITVDLPITADIAVSGEGSVQATVSNPVTADIAVSGGGTVSMVVVPQITANVGIVADDGIVAIIADVSIPVDMALTGGGTVSMTVDVPITVDIAVRGEGTVYIGVGIVPIEGATAIFRARTQSAEFTEQERLTTMTARKYKATITEV